MLSARFCYSRILSSSLKLGSPVSQQISYCQPSPTEDKQHSVCQDVVSLSWNIPSYFSDECPLGLPEKQSSGVFLVLHNKSLGSNMPTILSLWLLSRPRNFQHRHLIYGRHHFFQALRRYSNSLLGVAPGILARTSWGRRKQKARRVKGQTTSPFPLLGPRPKTSAELREGRHLEADDNLKFSAG